ncbi:hypothetical protein Ddye_026116 [Dipteronia dyeriana]|uniref:ADP/ATP translocase n=1 Tax=Dipteronia dyeriana TaxID=168575 RepID=A0AAD9TLN3_9ROSI|nr:hypothetical protein Ddye_026116 [Dipteronia dyeriana]
MTGRSRGLARRLGVPWWAGPPDLVPAPPHGACHGPGLGMARFLHRSCQARPVGFVDRPDRSVSDRSIITPLDAFSQIVKNEGATSLFKGASANILRAVASASVLVGYDKLQLILLGKKCESGGG